MIVPPRWIKLKEVREQLLQHVVEGGDGYDENADPEAIANTLTWDFCEKAKAVYLHKCDDEAVEYPKVYVEPPEGGKHLRTNELVDLCIGVPGSGTKKYPAVGKGPTIFDIMGPYLGSPVIFQRVEFNKFFSKIVGPVTKSPLGSEAGMKEHFLNLHTSGKYANKEDVWEKVRSSTTRRILEKGFQAAKKQDPTFGKQGRPPGKNKPDG